MTVTCSKGTYIRSLCYDIGEALNVGATMTDLKRSKTSVFEENESINIEDLTEENIENYIIKIEKALEMYSKLIVSNNYTKLLINGVKLSDTRFTKDTVIVDKLYRVYDEDDNFIGLGKKDNQGFKIQKLLNN